MVMNQEKPAKQVLILGGGYAGVNAALRLRLRDKHAKITLVNERRQFIERIRNHQAAAGQKRQVHQLAQVLGSGVQFVEGRAEKIDAAKRRVLVQSHGGVAAFRYDVLIYALGSAGAIEVPGVYHINDREATERLREDLSRIQSDGAVILGAGLTGLELATELRESFPGKKITLVDRKRPGSGLSAKARDYLDQVLTDMQISFETAGENALADKNFLTQCKRENIAVVNCTGFAFPALAKNSGIACDNRNRVLVNAHLQLEQYPEIFAAGDAVAYGFGSEGIAYAGCATASPMGTYVGEAVAKFLAGERLPEFHYGFTFQCISLGRKRGIIQFLDKRSGAATARVMTGKSAAIFKEMICRMTVTLPRWERKTRWPFYTWRKTRLMKRIGKMAAKAA